MSGGWGKRLRRTEPAPEDGRTHRTDDGGDRVPTVSAVAGLLGLQRSAGNRAVTRMQASRIQRQEEEEELQMKPAGRHLPAHELSHVMQGAAQRSPVTVTPTAPGVVQRKDFYAYGAANTTPHIHVYSGGDCHLKVAGGDRYDLVQGGFKRPAGIHEAFEWTKSAYPAGDERRTNLLAALRACVKDVPVPANYKPFEGKKKVG